MPFLYYMPDINDLRYILLIIKGKILALPIRVSKDKF